MLDSQPCVNVGARRQPQPPCFPQCQPAPWKWLQDPPLPLLARRTVWPQRGWCAAPMLAPHSWSWRAWHVFRQGLCLACRRLGSGLACGHKHHGVLHHLFQNQGGGKEDLTVPGRPHTGRSPLRPAPWRSSLIQSQHNGAEMAPLILLGRRSHCTVGISNGFLPRGTGSQDSTLRTAPWWKQSSSLLATRNMPVEPLVLGNRAMAAAAQGN